MGNASPKPDTTQTPPAGALPTQDPSAAAAATAMNLGNLGGEPGKKEHFDGFDPTGLERAAKAAKELQDLKYADEAIKISREQEITKQREAAAKIEENRSRQKAFEAERVRIQEEERRKTIEKDQQARQQNSYYQDQLARKRQEDQMNAERAMRDENIRKQEESQMRIESLRRQTAEYEANIKKQAEKARAEAEALGRTEQERKNWDLHMQRSKMEAQEFRVTVLDGIREAGTILGQGMKDYISDYEKLGNTALVFTAIALGIYTAKNTTSVAARLVEARFGKPPLVRETSRFRPSDLARRPFTAVANALKSRGDALEGIVLHQTLEERLRQIAVSTANTKKNASPYRHMMLYGPPGTGKTMFAKSLAASSGMDYAIMTGGDVAPLGRDAVTEIHKLFDWSNTSRKGLLLFVDEADAFLQKRTQSTLSEDLRNALNAFLYRTGDSSKNFMVVLATNQPDQLDWAINDRVDELVKFDLPGLAERETLLRQYYQLYVVDSHKTGGFSILGGPKEIRVEDVSDEIFAEFAKLTETFSGREISKLAIAWQAAARGTSDCTLTGAMMRKILEDRLVQHKQRLAWETDHIE